MRKTIHTDEKISQWMAEVKLLPIGWEMKLWADEELYVWGEQGSKFRIKLNPKPNPLYFSVILMVYPFNDDRDFRLRRYNGIQISHRNKRRGRLITGFHIHYATEKCQRQNEDEERFALSTNRYNDMRGALQCLLKDANFQEPEI